MPKAEWQIREKHFRDFNFLAKEKLGFMDTKGNMRKWDGKVFYPMFKELGHDSVQFVECECYQNWIKNN